MQDNIKKVLIITYYFPPQNAIGARRLYGLAKYIKNFGWEPVVLTVKMPRNNRDEFNIIEVDYPGNIHDLFHFAFDAYISADNFLWEFVSYPDKFKNLEKRILREIEVFLENNKVDAIITSSHPETLHLAAKKIKDKYNIPWLADMRDLWTQLYYIKRNPVRNLFEQQLEKSTLKKADAITTVSEPLAEVQSRFLGGKTVFPIQNGFDPEELPQENIEQHDKFTITYTGHLYARELYNMDYFFEALSELIKDGLIDKHKISVKYYGVLKQNPHKEAEKFDIEGIVRFHGRISREESLIEQKKAHILLHYQCENEDYKGVYGGKIFEYLCIGRPVLITGGNKDVLWELLDQTDAGKHALTKQEIKDFVLCLYNEWLNTGKISYRAKQEEIDKYNYISMAGKFADILDSITK